MHVHTSRSDGLGRPDDVAAAAARAGLKFLIFTDHGDATRPPDAPTYRSGVLCLDGVEISTSGGHYLAIDMPASPYPLGGEPRDVVEDVARLGGFGVAAHPDSPKPELRWEDWTAPIDGVELAQSGHELATDRRRARLGIEGPSARRASGLSVPSGRIDRAVDSAERGAATVERGRWSTKSGHRGRRGRTRQARTQRRPRELAIRAASAVVRVVVQRVVDPRAARRAAFRCRRLGCGADPAGHQGGSLCTSPSMASRHRRRSNSRRPTRPGRWGRETGLASGGLSRFTSAAMRPSNFVTYVHDGLRTISTVRDSQDVTVHAGDGARRVLGRNRVTGSTPHHLDQKQSDLRGRSSTPPDLVERADRLIRRVPGDVRWPNDGGLDLRARRSIGGCRGCRAGRRNDPNSGSGSVWRTDPSSTSTRRWS